MVLAFRFFNIDSCIQRVQSQTVWRKVVSSASFKLMFVSILLYSNAFLGHDHKLRLEPNLGLTREILLLHAAAVEKMATVF